MDAIRTELRPEPARPAPPVPAPRPLAPPRPSPAVTAPPPAPKRRRTFDASTLLGPQALAWAGGVVTLLGVVFFFILAVNNGWIGPGARVACGAVASALVFGGGLWLRRRFGETYASLAAVGAGIAGAYATLAAAAAMYHLVPDVAALVGAAGIAAASVAVALAWRAEILAALGLVGAIAAPALLATQGGLSPAGVGFAAIMTAAALAVGIRMRWPWLLVGSAAASAPQIAALVVTADRFDSATIAMTCVFALLYLGAGIAEQLARKSEALAPLPTAFVLGSMALTWIGSLQLFGPADGDAAGVSLLIAAAAFAAASVALWLRSQRELATLLGAISVAATAVGIANILSGTSLAYAFAAEAAVLALAAKLVREPRLQLAAGAYLCFAICHVIAVDSPPDTLFDVARHPATGIGAVIAAALAAFMLARLTGNGWNDSAETGVLRFLAPLVRVIRNSQRELHLLALTVAAVLVIDAASLGVLELAERVWSGGGVENAFDRGHLALAALWSAAGLVAVAIGTRRSPTLRIAGFAWLGLVSIVVVAYDAVHLDGGLFTGAFLSIAAALLLSGYAREVLCYRTSVSVESASAVAAAALLASASLFPYSAHAAGLGLLGIAGAFALVAASIFTRPRLRDLSTTIWVCAAVLAAVSGELLVHGTQLAVAWAGGGGAIAVLAVLTRERRLLVAAGSYIALGACVALDRATPAQLVIANDHPARGILGLLVVGAALCVLAWAFAQGRVASLWTAGIVAVYAASLAILDIALRLSNAPIETEFQRGHSGVSALWGVLGLALLYIGLRHHRRALRIGGFALLGVSLAKLFLYDLSQLSSVTRALSFLAVGAVLLLGGFFTQRLTAERDPVSPAT